MERTARKSAACLLLLSGLALMLFLATVELRRDWVTYAKDGWTDHEIIALAGLRNLYREGLLDSWGAMCWKPRSIETPALHDCGLYYSVPPGGMIPPLVVSKISGKEPSLSLLRQMALAHHVLIALAVTWTAWVCLRQLGYIHRDAFLLACVPMLLTLGGPQPLLAYRIGPYFYKAPVLLPFALYVLLEVLRDSIPQQRRGRRRALALLQGAVAFWGIMTEWIIACVLLCVYLKRVVRGEMGRTVWAFLGKTVVFGLAPALAIGLFFLQIWHFGILPGLYEKTKIMTGLAPQAIPSSSPLFLLKHLGQGYGLAGLALFGAALLCAGVIAAYAGMLMLRRRKVPLGVSRSLMLIFITFVPCVIYSAVLHPHVAHPFHFFSSYQFLIAFVLIPFLLVPVLIASITKKITVSDLPRPRLWFPVALIVAALGYIGVEFPAVLARVAYVNQDPAMIAAAKFLDANTGYEDVVFTQDPEFPKISGRQYIGYSMKQVYAARTLQSIYEKVQGLQGEYVINVLSRGPDSLASYSFLRGLIEKAYGHRAANGFHLHKIRKADFLDFCREQGLPETYRSP